MEYTKFSVELLLGEEAVELIGRVKALEDEGRAAFSGRPFEWHLSRLVCSLAGSDELKAEAKWQIGWLETTPFDA